MNRVMNEEVRRRAGIESELASTVDQRVLRCFEQVERMDKYSMAIRFLMGEVSGVRYGWTEVRFDGWREGGLWQQSDDGEGSCTMPER